MAMPSNRIAFLLAALMCAASIGAVVARPGTKAADLGPAISLETMIPKQFGEWREEPQRIVQVVNPQTQELLDKLYSQILTRTYVNAKRLPDHALARLWQRSARRLAGAQAGGLLSGAGVHAAPERGVATRDAVR